MPSDGALTPREAAHIATNSYFTLKNWINEEPTAGTESRSNISNRVLGDASVGSGSHQKTSLQGTGLSGPNLGNVHQAKTGFGTESGFGYTLTYEDKGQKHLVIATRGTRPELGAPDLITDARGSMTSFGSYGPVHKGFKKTFDSIMPSLMRDRDAIRDAKTVH